jgi:hypothetical protein
MSRTSKTLELASTEIYRAAAQSVADQISVTIQNPKTNSGYVEIAWDDVDTPLITGNGLLLAPGDRITLTGLPLNEDGNIGVVGCTVTAPPLAVRVIIATPQ